MSEHQKPDSLDALVEAATNTVRQQQDMAAAMAAKRPVQPRGRQVLSWILLAVLAAVLVHQYPRIAQPYALPDPKADLTVVAAELEVIGELIESYRLSSGSYPASLNDVQLPAGLAEVVAHSSLAYQIKDQAFTLDWKLPHWNAVLDGGTGKVEVTPVSGAR